MPDMSIYTIKVKQELNVLTGHCERLVDAPGFSEEQREAIAKIANLIGCANVSELQKAFIKLSEAQNILNELTNNERIESIRMRLNYVLEHCRGVLRAPVEPVREISLMI